MGILAHRFISAVADGPYATQVNPSNWNEPHSFSGGNNGSILVRSTSAASSSEGVTWVNPSAVANTILMGQGSSAKPAYSTAAYPATAAIGDVMVATAANVFAGLGLSAAGAVLTSASSSAAPVWFSGNARVAAQVDVTGTAALANVTGLSVNVSAGLSYAFEAVLYTTSSSATGVKFAIAGTATATAITYEALVHDATIVKAQTRAAALATAVGGISTVTVALARINGTITVANAGTLTVQFAQNSSSVSTSSVLRGSSLSVNQIA